MLKFLILTTALSALLVPFLPGVAFGLPLVGNSNYSSPVILDPNGNLVNPNNSYPTGTIDPYSGSNTVIVNPNYPYSSGIITPYNSGPKTVIVNPTGPVIVNPPSQPAQQYSCSTAIIGSPIPSAVPLNTQTGRPCH